MYLNLSPPQSIFVHADGFLTAARSLQNPSGGPPFNPFCAPAIVTNLAFSTELYLKCLLQVETKQVVKEGHNLQKLFLMLPEQIRQEIEIVFNAVMAKAPAVDLSSLPKDAQTAAAKQPKNLLDALKAGGNAFVEWRYLYEFDENANAFGLFPLPEILRNIILKRKPEWAHFSIQMKKIA